MGVRYEVIHSSRYTYSEPAALSMNEACLSTRPTPFQRVLDHRFYTDPQDNFHQDRVDFFGNFWRLYAFERPHTHLEIKSVHLMEIHRGENPGDLSQGGFEPFLYPSPYVRTSGEFADYGRPYFPQGGDLVQGLWDINQKIFQDFTYDPGATEVWTPVEEFFQKRRGVCQDYAHLTIAILRSLGIPARYVSGYLNTRPPPGKEKILGADASHAWVSAYSPRWGWIDLDPTNGIMVGENHITLAWGRDYGDVTPLKGVVLGGGVQKLTVEVSVLLR